MCPSVSTLIFYLIIFLAYLSIGDYNIILVDWQKAAKNLLYWKVVKSVPLIATLVTNMINFLEENFGLNPNTTRAVGHSLGGHVVGLAARLAKPKIAEVIGKFNKTLWKKQQTNPKFIHNNKAKVIIILQKHQKDRLLMCLLICDIYICIKQDFRI